MSTTIYRDEQLALFLEHLQAILEYHMDQGYEMSATLDMIDDPRELSTPYNCRQTSYTIGLDFALCEPEQPLAQDSDLFPKENEALLKQQG